MSDIPKDILPGMVFETPHGQLTAICKAIDHKEELIIFQSGIYPLSFFPAQCKPIPLTPEILEKYHDFYRHDEEDSSFLILDGVLVGEGSSVAIFFLSCGEIWVSIKSDSCRYESKFVEMGAYLPISEVKYEHELQATLYGLKVNHRVREGALRIN